MLVGDCTSKIMETPMILMHYVIRESSQGHVADCGISSQNTTTHEIHLLLLSDKAVAADMGLHLDKSSCTLLFRKGFTRHAVAPPGGLNSPERAARRRRWKSFIVLWLCPFLHAAQEVDKKRNSGNTRGELLPTSSSLAFRWQAKTPARLLRARNPALRVLESDRPPGRRLKASHYVCVCVCVCASAGFFLPLFCCRKKKDSSHDCGHTIPRRRRILCECLVLVQCGHLVCVAPAQRYFWPRLFASLRTYSRAPWVPRLHKYRQSLCVRAALCASRTHATRRRSAYGNQTLSPKKLDVRAHLHCSA